MLTEPVTRTLPSAWHGDYKASRSREWIAERDKEGTTLLVIEKSTNEAVGLVILIEVDSENAGEGIEVRLGYLLAESAWGKGLATDLLGLLGHRHQLLGLFRAAHVGADEAYFHFLWLLASRPSRPPTVS